VLLRSDMPCSNTMLSTDNLYRCRDAANYMQQDLSNDGIASLRASCKDWKCVIDGAVHTATPSQLRLQQLQHMYVEPAHLHQYCTRDGEVTQCAFLQVPQPARPRPAAPAAGIPGPQAPAPADTAHLTQAAGLCMRQAQQSACAGPRAEPNAAAAAGAPWMQQGKASSLISPIQRMGGHTTPYAPTTSMCAPPP
jgi:hypothetical protein